MAINWAAAQAHYEQASPLLLAMTKPVAPPTPPIDDEEWAKLREHCESRLMMARSWRFSWIEHWALIAQYLNPRRSLWLSQGGVDQPVPNSMVRGLPVNQSIVDPTATYAMQICAAGMMSGLMGPSRPWFKLGPGIKNYNLDTPAKLWYEEVEDRLYKVFSESNFYTVAAQMFKDLCSFGTGPVIVYEDAEDIIRCLAPVTGEYYIFVGPSGRVEGFIRQWVVTVSQCVEQFGLENCPDDVKDLWRQKGSNLEREIIVASLIEPNFAIQQLGDKKPYGKVKGGFTYREVIWKYGAGTPYPLSLRGFHEWPVPTSRWQVNGNDPYGSDSPGMVALGDYMQLQQETRRKGELLEKLVRPPLNASIELKNQPSSILPGHATYTSDPKSKGMFPIFEVDAQALPGITADIALLQARIKSGFFNDLFLMIASSEQEMTAFEVAQRQQEKMQVLGPVIELFNNEFASPAIARVLAIMQRKRLLPPMPRSLIGVPMEIKYISMLALAAKSVATAGIERTMTVTLKVATEGQKPELLDIVNWEEAIREYGDLLDVSKKMFNDEKQVAALRAARQQQAQQAQAAQAATHTVPALAGAAKDVAGIDVGGGINAAQLMLGMGGQPSGAPAQ